MFFGGFECVRVWRRGWRRGEGGREREEEEGETFFFSTLEHQREAETQKTNLLFLSFSPSPFPYRARAADPDVLGDDLASLCFEKVGFTKKRGKEKKRFELEKSRERNLGHRRKKRLAVGPERKKKKVSSNSQKKKKKKKKKVIYQYQKKKKKKKKQHQSLSLIAFRIPTLSSRPRLLALQSHAQSTSRRTHRLARLVSQRAERGVNSAAPKSKERTVGGRWRPRIISLLSRSSFSRVSAPLLRLPRLFQPSLPRGTS